MRITIKYLQDKLDREIELKNKYYNNWKKLEDEKEEKERNNRFRMEIEERAADREINRLFQIIRILTNDPTRVIETNNQYEQYKWNQFN